MAKIKAQKIPRPQINPEDILASFCYHFPHYSYNQARKMPFKRINALLKIARKEHARKMMDLLRIVAAPHSRNKGEVRKLFQEFSDILNGS